MDPDRFDHDDFENPYAPPDSTFVPDPPQDSLARIPFTVGDLCNWTWSLYKERFGICLTIILGVGGINLMLSLVSNILLNTVETAIRDPIIFAVSQIGIIFRWKGENVSTAEVLGALTAAPHVLDGVVFGIGVPGTEGRAGMAALVVDEHFDVGLFRAHVAAQLPVYARPVFLRLVPALDLTATFKPRKLELVRDGYDPAQVSDPLFVDDARSGAYVPLDRERHEAIAAGRVRL